MFDDYCEEDYQSDRAQGQLDAWEHAHPANYDPLNALIDAMVLDLIVQELLAR